MSRSVCGHSGPAPAGSWDEHAPAKINLTLRVLGRRADGYHELESLVAFAGIGDEVTVSRAERDTLTLEGPFAGTLADADNLITRARDALRTVARVPPVAIALRKNLPVASGIGGGSADAAATLRALSALAGLDDAALAALAPALGADVPVCLAARPAWMTGIGERLAPLVAFPRMALVLLNPGVSLATGDVFARLNMGDGRAAQGARPDGFTTIDDLVSFLERGGNDLEAPAVALAPVIGEAKARLRALPGCRLARMSGSGATLFGLFESDAQAAAAAASLSADHPAWWCVASALVAA